MNEKVWLFRATLLIVALGIINLFGLLTPVWLLAGTIFGGFLLFYERISQQLTTSYPKFNEQLSLLFVLMLFFAFFGYMGLHTNINEALKDEHGISGKINDTLSLLLLGITLAFYVRK